MRLALLVGSTLLLATHHMLEAQLAPGNRLRVQHATACCGLTMTTGRFVALTPRELLLNERRGVTDTVPRESIRTVERAVPGDSHIYLGTVLGMIAGAAAGFVYGTAHPGCKAEAPCPDYLVGAAVALPVGLAGGAVGWFVGSRFKRQAWEPVDLPMRVGVAGDTHGYRIVIVGRH